MTRKTGKKAKARKARPAQDPVRAHLAERGSPDPVVKAGLAGLVGQWEDFAKAVGKRYDLGIEDYLNDLDVRQLIADVWDLAAVASTRRLAGRLAAADKRVRAATKAAAACLWGSKVAKREAYTPEANWWYYALPKRAGAELREAVAEVS
ncbi:MAG: hypothetical protein R3F56_09185 [Planctomycetota bacterium]